MNESKRNELSGAGEAGANLAELLCAIDAVLRDQLDRIEVHPCDEYNDDIKSRGMNAELRQLYKVRRLFCT